MADSTLKALVLDELQRGTDSGEGRSRQQLREAVGLGAGDLEAILSDLRQAGVATEQAPDEYVLTAAAGGASPEEVADAEVEEPGVSLDEAEARAAAEPPPPAGPLSAWQAGAYREEYARAATVTMPRAMVDAIDADALGKILKAGIDASEDGVSFVFEVTP